MVISVCSFISCLCISVNITSNNSYVAEDYYWDFEITIIEGSKKKLVRMQVYSAEFPAL